MQSVSRNELTWGGQRLSRGIWGQTFSGALDRTGDLRVLFPSRPGPLALLLAPGTHLTVTRFTVSGTPLPATWTWLASEAITGAGVSEEHYRTVDSTDFRFGTGIVCDRPDERLKWNSRGRGFRLWLPKGLGYGRCAVRLNGLPLGELDLHSAAAIPSAVVFERTGLPDGYHALVIQGIDAPLPADCLEAQM